MTNTHHDPEYINTLADKFTVLPHNNRVADAKREQLIDKPAFGQIFSDSMVHMTWTEGELYRFCITLKKFLKV